MSKIKDRYQLDPYKDIPDVWILNSSFQKLGLIDDYTSLIWSRRYYEVGDFELYVRVTDKNMKLLNVDLSETARFIMRNDTKEVMRIEKVEISVDAEEGDFITASGRDLRCLLYQRCLITDVTAGELYEDPVTGEETGDMSINICEIIYQMVSLNCVNPEDENRKIPYMTMDTKAPVFDNVITSYMKIDASTNVGEKTEEICNDFKIGWRNICTFQSNGTPKIRFECYEGQNKTKSVVFSEEFANLINYKDSDNIEEYYNAMILISEDTESGAKNTTVFGDSDAKGLVRFEKGFTGETDLDVPTSVVLGDLIFRNKLPKAYNLHWGSYHWTGSTDNGYYVLTSYDSSVIQNPPSSWIGGVSAQYDIGRCGNDYMSDDAKVIISYGESVAYDPSARANINIEVSTLYYEFRIWSDAWKEELIGYIGNIGETVIKEDGIEYYIVDGRTDKTKRIKLASGNYTDKYWTGSNNTWGRCWELTIPAEYSDTGETITDFSLPETTSNNGIALENHTVPFAMSLELEPVFIRERYMSKAYSMVEANLSSNEFEGEIAPDVNYKYREDYDIGDKIRIKTDIGIQKDVRILEAVETFDSDGYNIEVKFGV